MSEQVVSSLLQSTRFVNKHCEVSHLLLLDRVESSSRLNLASGCYPEIVYLVFLLLPMGMFTTLLDIHGSPHSLLHLQYVIDFGRKQSSGRVRGESPECIMYM